MPNPYLYATVALVVVLAAVGVWLGLANIHLQSLVNSLESKYSSLEGEYSLLAGNYSALKTQYASLSLNYSRLEGMYSSLEANYSRLKITYTTLSENYTMLSSAFNTLKANYTTLNNEYNILNAKFMELNENYTKLQANYSSLQLLLNVLNTSLTSLVNRYSALSSMYLWSSVQGYPMVEAGSMNIVIPNRTGSITIIAIPVQVINSYFSISLMFKRSLIYVGNYNEIIVMLAPYKKPLTLLETEAFIKPGCGNTGEYVNVLLPENLAFYWIFNLFTSSTTASTCGYLYYASAGMTPEDMLYAPNVIQLSLNSTPSYTIISYIIGYGGGAVSMPQSSAYIPFTNYSFTPQAVLSNGEYWLVIEFVNGPGSYVSNGVLAGISYTTEGWSLTYPSPIVLNTPPPSAFGINLTEALYNTSYFVKALEPVVSFINSVAQFISRLGGLPSLNASIQFACYATAFRFNNGTSGMVGVIVGSNSIYQVDYSYQFPHGTEYLVTLWAYPYPSPYVAYPTYIYGYLVDDVTVFVSRWGVPFTLPNGTYVGWLVFYNNTSLIWPCIIQYINVPNPEVFMNYTFLGAQYWAWFRSQIYFGKLAPCYEPFEWTIGWFIRGINITEPIGQIWQYYCGPNGVWTSLKP